MGIIGTLYANFLLWIADVSVRLFAPPPETVTAPDYQRDGDYTRLRPTGNQTAQYDVNYTISKVYTVL